MEGCITEQDSLAPGIHEEEVHVLYKILMFCIKILIIKVIWILMIDGKQKYFCKYLNLYYGVTILLYNKPTYYCCY